MPDENPWHVYEIGVRIIDVPRELTNAHTKKGPGDDRLVGPLYAHVRDEDPLGSPSHRGIIKSVLHLKEETFQAISKYLNISRGRPHDFEDKSYHRFLYLSVVTITTLGYGDLVPLTRPARDLVAIESVFGLIIMGLFVNALVQSGNQKVGQTTRTLVTVLVALSGPICTWLL